MSFTFLPCHVSESLRVLRSCFRHRDRLVFKWLFVLHLVCGKWSTRRRRHALVHLASSYQRFSLYPAYWCMKTLLWWLAEQVLQPFPLSEGGLLYLESDDTLKGKRGPKHPVA